MSFEVSIRICRRLSLAEDLVLLAIDDDASMDGVGGVLATTPAIFVFVWNMGERRRLSSSLKATLELALRLAFVALER